MDSEMPKRRRVVIALVSALLPQLFVATAVAQNVRPKDLEHCNGVEHGSPDLQIEGCTALINSKSLMPRGLAIAHNNRGIAHTKKKEYDRAIQDFDDSINFDPNYAKAFNNRGVAYQRKGEYNHAIDSLDESIKLNSDYAIAFANRAETFQRMGDTRRAIEDYDAVIRLQPKYDKLIQGRPDLESEWKRTLIIVRNERCRIRAISGQLQLALTDCDEALRLQPDVAAVLGARGLTYLKMGRWDDAIADYDSALRLEPKMASSLYGRGLAKLKRGDTAGGQADIGAAIAIKRDIVADFTRYGVK
jgi:tetratricopeptide (TPR) repeat protein